MWSKTSECATIVHGKSNRHSVLLQTHLKLCCGDTTQSFVACTGESEVSVLHRKDTSRKNWLYNLFTVFVSLQTFYKIYVKKTFLKESLNMNKKINTVWPEASLNST
jgi:hypothetical protein